MKQVSAHGNHLEYQLITRRFGVGSNRENVAFFDFNNNLLPHGGMEVYRKDNVKVTFEVNIVV